MNIFNTRSKNVRNLFNPSIEKKTIFVNKIFDLNIKCLLFMFIHILLGLFYDLIQGFRWADFDF